MARSSDHPAAGSNSRRTSLPADAEAMVAEVYLPHRLDLPQGVSTVDLEMVSARIGAMTVGHGSYGRRLVVHTDETQDVYIAFVLRGRAEMSSGTGEASVVEVGSAAVFPVGAPGHISVSEDCVGLVIRIPRETLETELEHLLGHALTDPLELAFNLDMRTRLGKSWEPVLRLLVEELRRPTALTRHPAAARRVEALVLDALLLGHEHNYRDLLDRASSLSPRSAVGCAIQLIETNPTEAWSTVRLAREVHLSVRALQARFRRDVDMSPMDYVRQARLRRVRVALVDATPQTTTVRALAQRYGFAHLGRFAALYRQTYGESPATTLRRTPLG